MEQKIFQCTESAIQMGFEPAKKARLPFTLENITCDGGRVLRAAIVTGTSMIRQIRQVHIKLEIPNLWQFIHLVITEGMDKSSKFTKQDLQDFMSQQKDLLPCEVMKTFYIGVDLHKIGSNRQELEQLEEIGGKGAELKCIGADQMGQLFQGIILQLQNRVQVQYMELWQNNYILNLKEKELSNLHLRQRYLILFTLDVSKSMAGSRMKNVTKTVREILNALDDDDMVCGLVFNDECHGASQINTQTWNREIYYRREKEKQQQELKNQTKDDLLRQILLNDKQQKQENDEQEEEQAEWEIKQLNERDSATCQIQ